MAPEWDRSFTDKKTTGKNISKEFRNPFNVTVIQKIDK